MQRVRGGKDRKMKPEVQKGFGVVMSMGVQGIENWRKWLELYEMRYICEVDVCTFADVIVSCMHKIELIILLHLLYPIIAGLWLLSFTFLNILFAHLISNFQSNSPASHILQFLCIYRLYISFHSTFHTSVYMHVSMFVVFQSIFVSGIVQLILFSLNFSFNFSF